MIRGPLCIRFLISEAGNFTVFFSGVFPVHFLIDLGIDISTLGTTKFEVSARIALQILTFTETVFDELQYRSSCLFDAFFVRARGHGPSCARVGGGKKATVLAGPLASAGLGV